VYAIGETPDKQLRPAIRLLTERYRARRWMLIGNDYIWPRKSHALAKAYLTENGADVISEQYLHIGQGPGRQNFDAIFELIEKSMPDAILISLVGQDAIDFNRQFGRLKLSTKIIRLSCAIEENGLLAIGADNTDGLFVSSGYFAALKSEANMSFMERYYTRYGERAPTLNAIGQSTYEGMHFLAALASRALSSGNEEWLTSTVKPLSFCSVRGIDYRSNGYSSAPIYLAEAQGHAFRVLNHFI
jgi:ABC-type branched-subunit amino acid transport system substrate-binding protein